MRLGEDLETVADADDGPPASANRTTSAITGEKRATAPQRM